MASNSFGKIFQITTWGESHSKAMGVVIDGCPANLSISEEIIFYELKRRRPGWLPYVSQRKEEDQPRILSGVFEGKTTGAPLLILIENKDVKSEHYSTLKEVYRPSHGEYAYHKKYGNFDFLGSGRFSGRETASWVAAGAVAKALLHSFSIDVLAYLQSVGEIQTKLLQKTHFSQIKEKVDQNPLFCPEKDVSRQMEKLLKEMMEQNDSIGGVVGFLIQAPWGLGEPIFEKLQAKLAHGMMSIPGCKGFEIGEGFFLSTQRGSLVNDPFIIKDQTTCMETNHSGGVLAGISTGENIYGRVAFKPTPSIKQPQKTVDMQGSQTTVKVSKEARHDPCIAIRATPVVGAICALVMADLVLMNRLNRLEG